MNIDRLDNNYVYCQTIGCRLPGPLRHLQALEGPRLSSLGVRYLSGLEDAAELDVGRMASLAANWRWYRKGTRSYGLENFS